MIRGGSCRRCRTGGRSRTWKLLCELEGVENEWGKGDQPANDVRHWTSFHNKAFRKKGTNPLLAAALVPYTR